MVFKCLKTQPSNLSAIKDLEGNDKVVNLNIQLKALFENLKKEGKPIILEYLEIETDYWKEKRYEKFFDEITKLLKMEAT